MSYSAMNFARGQSGLLKTGLGGIYAYPMDASLGNEDSYYVNYRIFKGKRRDPEKVGYHKKEKITIVEL